MFEIQLVPTLISHLQPEDLVSYPATTQSETDTGSPSVDVTSSEGDGPNSSEVKSTASAEEERKTALAALAAGRATDGVCEMEWGSIYVFGCEADCVGFGEEWVGVDWEAIVET